MAYIGRILRGFMRRCFEQGLKGASHAVTEGGASLAEGSASVKALRWEHAWFPPVASKGS